MPRWLRFAFGLVIAAVIVVTPLVYSIYREHKFRNLHVVTPGVLYRSGQLTKAGLERLIHDHQFKTLITLRFAPSPAQPAPDEWEEHVCGKAGVRHVRLPHLGWDGPNGAAPNDVHIKTFCDVMRDPDNHPVLIHCFAGIHRTGTYCAVYRMEFEGWSPSRAMDEMRQMNYTILDEHADVVRFLTRYRPQGAGTPAPTPVQPASFVRPTQGGATTAP